MPTINGLKVGDIYKYYNETFIYSFGEAYINSEYRIKQCGFYYLSEHGEYSEIAYGFRTEKCYNDPLSEYKPIYNIFQEYAKIGIIENELLNNFFK